MRLKWWLVATMGILALWALTIVLRLDIPQPTGPHAVGRTTWRWEDGNRPEPMTAAPDDHRQLSAEVWYPAIAESGTMSPYMPDLERIAGQLLAGDEISPLEVWGLRFVRYHARQDATLVAAETAYPVILLSPGNATNAEFYAGLADELASRGYVVVGLNHPFDVAAVALANGEIAAFVPGPVPIEENELWTRARMVERVADLRFALDQLERINSGEDERFSGRLDLSRVGVMGHSLGGVAAAMACSTDERLSACLNVDGLQRGGPFSTEQEGAPPLQPFMFITKEETLHPILADRFAATQTESYRVVIHGAQHDDFADGAVLMAAFVPFASAADRALNLTRAYTAAFFDKTLRGLPTELLARSSDGQDVSVELYGPAGE